MPLAVRFASSLRKNGEKSRSGSASSEADAAVEDANLRLVAVATSDHLDRSRPGRAVLVGVAQQVLEQQLEMRRDPPRR